MNINEVIKFPILTEKTYKQMSNGYYTFAVDKRTNKAEVKKVVQYIFDVKVENVNIMTIRKKPKKMGKFAGFVPGYKKTIVKLKKGESISLFPNENENVPIKNEENNKKIIKETESISKTNQISEIEQKALAKIAAKKKIEQKDTKNDLAHEKDLINSKIVQEKNTENIEKESKIDQEKMNK